MRAIAERHRAEIRVAADDHERALLWKGRKSAFGAIARIKPDYYLHDTVVPRTALVDVLRSIYRIVDRHDLLVLNVFHAGDGNLHPILAYDSREPGADERVRAAGTRDHRGVVGRGRGALRRARHRRGEARLHDAAVHRRRPRPPGPPAAAFDPHCRLNPGKVLPSPHSCADIASLAAATEEVWG